VEEVQTAESAQSASQAPVDHGSPDTSASNQTPGLDELLSQYDTVTEAQKMSLTRLIKSALNLIR
jgi:hypothetical protein